MIVGQREVLEELLITVFAGGHNLLEGVPGLAKTLMISTLARLLSLDFKRIQFTPDLMPSDIVGTNIIEEDHTTGQRVHGLRGRPDLHQRPAGRRDQPHAAEDPGRPAAGHAGAGSHRRAARPITLPAPFFVLATQNPIDQEGTYPLPEAQKDRFLLNTFIKYPGLAEEEDIVERTTSTATAPSCRRSATATTLLKFQQLVRSIPVSKHVTGYAVDLVRATRPDEPGVPAFIKEQVGWGAGRGQPGADPVRQVPMRPWPGRLNVSCDDVRHLALPVLRHRIVGQLRRRGRGHHAPTRSSSSCWRRCRNGRTSNQLVSR